MKKKAVIVSGYFNPIHKGHIEYINLSKKDADFLIVIVNNDFQRKLKGSKEFMDENERQIILKNIKAVDRVYLSIDKDSYVVKVDGNEVFFPKKEFELLHFLATNPKKVFSRESLLRNIWGADVHVVARTVDVHIRKIREKLGQDFISTIKGVGYKFKN